jgi:hypothetical protein
VERRAWLSLAMQVTERKLLGWSHRHSLDRVAIARR